MRVIFHMLNYFSAYILRVSMLGVLYLASECAIFLLNLAEKYLLRNGLFAWLYEYAVF